MKAFRDLLDQNFGGGDKISLDNIYDLYLAIDENLPLDVHLSMFIPVLMYHTSPEQRDMWLKPARRLDIIGAYAQTELGHGSAVRKIATTAHFDQNSDEFIINSPDLNSTKWWPGGLGKTCTHAVVYAQLIIHDKNFGVHPFMVQIRSLETHKTLEGIKLGDIGPKLGYNSMDNGYAAFKHVRIPRSWMLNGFASVSRNGKYSKSKGSEKIAYGIMTSVRARIVSNSSYVLARALTISLRYSCVRVQGSNLSKTFGAAEKGETPVIEYPTQRGALLPLLSFAWALHFTGKMVWNFYREVIGESFEDGNSAVNLYSLGHLHGLTAGLKAFVTQAVSDGMET